MIDTTTQHRPGFYNTEIEIHDTTMYTEIASAFINTVIEIGIKNIFIEETFTKVEAEGTTTTTTYIMQIQYRYQIHQ